MQSDNDNLAQSKTCTKCGETKPVSEFHKDRHGKGGLASQCASCKSQGVALWKEQNPNYGKEYYRANKTKLLTAYKEWRLENPDYKKEYRLRDIEKSRAVAREESKRRRSTPKGHVDDAMSAGIRDTLKRGEKRGTKWEELVGYTVGQLMSHLERQFKPGMSWANYGRNGWHIDHVIPKSVFNYKTPYDVDFKRCWALSNLQPLWERDNLSKGAKLEGGFQPSLALALPDNDNVKRKEEA